MWVWGWHTNAVTAPCDTHYTLLMQEGVVQSAKEAFEAMPGSGGWSVYNNKAARRIGDGGHSSGHTHEASL